MLPAHNFSKIPLPLPTRIGPRAIRGYANAVETLRIFNSLTIFENEGLRNCRLKMNHNISHFDARVMTVTPTREWRCRSRLARPADAIDAALSCPEGDDVALLTNGRTNAVSRARPMEAAPVLFGGGSDGWETTASRTRQ